MKLLFCLIALALIGGACAQETYLGVSGAATFPFDIESVSIATGTALVSPGVQLGVRNLLGPIGLRVTGEYSVVPTNGLLELSGDALLHLGTAIDPYIGGGASLFLIQGARLGAGRAVIGFGPRLGPNLGLFAEGVLGIYLGGSETAYTVKARGGINLFF